MTLEQRKELASLLSAIVDSRGTDESMERLDGLLSGDESAQAYYLHYLAIHTELEREHGRSENGRVRTKGRESSRRPWRVLVLATAACIAIGLGLGVWFRPFRTEETARVAPPSTRPSDAAEGTEKVLAVVANAEGAVWESEENDPTPGQRLGLGEFRLKEGRLLLDFMAGERVTIEAPAVFDLLEVNRLSLSAGSLVASITPQGKGFTVLLPHGAIVDMGTEFAASVGADGKNRVKVIKGSVMASSTNQQGNTSCEEILVGGDEFAIFRDLPLVRESGSTVYPKPLAAAIDPLDLGSDYARDVLASEPLGYWRFDAVDSLGRVRDETGRVPLGLKGMAVLGASENGGFLIPTSPGRVGCAVSEEAYPGLNTSRGCSMEFWANSDSVDWQVLGGLVLDGPRPEGLLPEHARHSPHMLLLERAGASGSKAFHVHPDFAMRALFRSPAGYTGGVNAYSASAYLIHRWHHIVVAKGDERLRIYLDGELSGESEVAESVDGQSYKLLIGRLHLRPDDGDARPWSGAIDEVALYDRVLQIDEIRRHFQASGRVAPWE
jgi:hypothetical protein